jgi:biopolymer transport protein ExbD
MAQAVAQETHVPLGEINTTPLIDVLLVLLVMLILTVPAAYHALPMDLPQPGQIDPATRIELVNALSVTAEGTITWNGASIDEPALVALLTQVTQRKPEPVIRFEPAGNAPYPATLRTLNIVKAVGPLAFALTGTERFAEFGKQ